MKIQNYTLIQQKPIPDYHGTAYLFNHNKTKARILYLSCPEDDNKVFSISFCTPPDNDKGIPHILEHCVLNGSRKFPVKEPFVELIKGSLHTFINAMTFEDKTMFPVASRNDKDFRNLMDVYLDAVFYPNLRKDPFILQQEGWHYEMTESEGPIIYKGVVYNEMKGAYSSPLRSLYREMEQQLYPDTVYSYESGGYPEAIPELSYEEFTAFHERYYHPSNSYIYFYGNGDIEEHLQFLDQEYLQHFEYREIHPVLGIQPNFAEPKERTAYYPASEADAREKEKAYLSYSLLLPPRTDALEYYTQELLEEILVNAEDAPIRKALQKAGIGKDIGGLSDNRKKQPSFSIIAKDAAAEDKDAFVRIIEEELARAVAEGLDARLVAGVLNSAEFRVRERDYGSTPQGLVVNKTCLDSWLYGRDPLELLHPNAAFKELRLRKDQGYFEQYIQEKLLHNRNRLILVLCPDASLPAAIQQKEEDKLRRYRDQLSEAERQTLCRTTRLLKERQEKPDSKEALATIPLLKIEDLEPKAEQFILQTVEKDERVLHCYPTFTNGIVYDRLYFSLDTIRPEELPYVGLMTSLLGGLSTDRYAYTDLDNEINIHTGGIGADTMTSECDGEVHAYLVWSGKFLTDSLAEGFSLWEEVLCHTHWDEIKRLKELVSECRSCAEGSLQSGGHSIALSRAMARLSFSSAYLEILGGLEYYLFLRTLEQEFDTRAEETIRILQSLWRRIVCRENVWALITAEEASMAALQEQTAALMNRLPQPDRTYEKVTLPLLERHQEALLTSGKIQYVAKSGRYEREYRGSMAVLGSILNLDYLWRRVRVQGGAYGCMERITRGGMVGFVSYRDPGLEETLQTFDEAGEVLKSFDCDERELTKYIIGTISGMSPVMSPDMKGCTALNRYLNALTPELLQTLWTQILQTSPEQIREDAQVLAEAMSHGVICVQGDRERLKDNPIFDQTIELI